MLLYDKIKKIEQLDGLIKRKATGTPEDLAQKLGISPASWYRLRDQLVNGFGFPIEYCPVKRTYFYTEEGTFTFGFVRHPQRYGHSRKTG